MRGDNREVYLATFNTSTLWERRRELRAVATQAANITALLDYVQWAIKEVISKNCAWLYTKVSTFHYVQIHEKWNEGVTPFSSKLQLLEGMLSGNN